MPSSFTVRARTYIVDRFRGYTEVFLASLSHMPSTTYGYSIRYTSTSCEVQGEVDFTYDFEKFLVFSILDGDRIHAIGRGCDSGCRRKALGVCLHRDTVHLPLGPCQSPRPPLPHILRIIY